MRISNSDPITGQAAWYDLRVSIEKAPADEAAVTDPLVPSQEPFPDIEPAPLQLRYGQRWKASTRSFS